MVKPKHMLDESFPYWSSAMIYFLGAIVQSKYFFRGYHLILQFEKYCIRIVLIDLNKFHFNTSSYLPTLTRCQGIDWDAFSQ